MKSLVRTSILALVLGLLMATAMDADGSTLRVADAERKALADPTLTAVSQDPQEQVTLEVSEDKSVVSVKLGGRFSETWLYSLGLKAPFDKDRQEEVSLADLDGLGSGNTASFRLTKEIIDFRPASGFSQLCQEYNDSRWNYFLQENPAWTPIDVDGGECVIERGGSLLDGDGLSELRAGDRGEVWAARIQQAQRMALRDACEEYNKAHPTDRLIDRSFAGPHGRLPPGYSDLCTETAMRSRLQAAWDSTKNKHLKKRLTKICSDYNDAGLSTTELIDVELGECDYKELKARGTDWAARAQERSPVNLYFLTFIAEATDNEFKFTEVDTLTASKTTEQNTSYGVSVAALKRGVYYSLAYKQQRLFKSAPKVELCQPLEGSGALSCGETALGPPQRVDREIGQLDVKWWLSPRVGTNVRLLFDFETDLWNPHLLVYFLAKKDAGLNGGLDIAYDDENDEVTARLFIGASFDLLPN